MVAKADTISESQFRRRFLRTGLRNFRADITHRAALPRHARCTMRDAECWRSPAGGKKQYYLDQEMALYLLGSGNNGRYYDAATGRFLSEDPTKRDGASKDSNSQLLAPNSSADANVYCYTGDDPANNLDPSGHDTKKGPPKSVYHPPQTQQGQQHNQAQRAHGARASQQHATPNQTHAEKPPSAGAAQDAAAAEGKRRTVMNFGQAAHQDQARIASLRANWQQDYNARLGLIHSNLSDAQLYSLMQHDIAQISTLQRSLTALHSEFDKAGLNQVTIPSVAIPHGEGYTLVRGGSGFENAARMAGEIGSAWAAEQSGNLGGLGPTYDEVAFAIGGPVGDLTDAVVGRAAEAVVPAVKSGLGKLIDAVGGKISELPGKAGETLGKLFGKTSSKGDASKVLQIGDRDLQKVFGKHGKDFSLSGNWNPEKATEVIRAINIHINNPATKIVKGTYRGQNVIHYLNLKTGLNVIVDPTGKFIGGWKLGAGQLKGVLATGRLY